MCEGGEEEDVGGGGGDGDPLIPKMGIRESKLGGQWR